MNGRARNRKIFSAGGVKRRRRKRLIGLIIFALFAAAVIYIGQALLFNKNKNDGFSEAANAQKPESPVATQNSEPAESVLGTSTNISKESTKASVQVEDWQLILVNPQNELPADFTVKLTQLSNGHAVDERCYPDLQQMMDDCRAKGLKPLICSSYRSASKQQQLFDNKVSGLVSQGYSKEEAKKEAATVIAVPGTSEHQTGLAVDIVDLGNQNLDKSQADTPSQLWLTKNCWRYGFILRYPEDKTGLTGISYEPWHYRYVGKEAAKKIYDEGLCLEEYLKP